MVLVPCERVFFYYFFLYIYMQSFAFYSKNGLIKVAPVAYFACRSCRRSAHISKVSAPAVTPGQKVTHEMSSGLVMSAWSISKEHLLICFGSSYLILYLRRTNGFCWMHHLTAPQLLMLVIIQITQRMWAVAVWPNGRDISQSVVACSCINNAAGVFVQPGLSRECYDCQKNSNYRTVRWKKGIITEENLNKHHFNS